MASDPFHSLGGFTTGIPVIEVVDANGNVVTNVNTSGNVSANIVYATEYKFANGDPLLASAAGSNTQVQYNNDNAFGADSTFTFDQDTKTLTVSNFVASGNLVNLGDVENLHISGGLNGYVLQTDGAGNLSWTAQTGNGGGNGSPGGSNMQVQFNDAGDFGGDAGFFYDKDTNILTVTGLTVTSDVNFNPTSLVNLGNISNLKISGGTSGQLLSTDGNSNLSFATVGDVPNVLYVAKNGNDSNDGTSLDSAKLTIAAAAAIATSGTTIFVKSGDYTENNPISIPVGVSIVGDNLRSVTVRPANPTQDIFWVRNRCYVTGITFRDHLSPSAAIAFPSSGAGPITTSPYIQNCSSITTTGCGMRIDGSLALGLKSMVTDSYTQFNQGGFGIHILNQGYAQLVSVFTICCTRGIFCESGGQCSVANSNNSFGDYALWAEGHSPELYSGEVVSVDFANSAVTINNLGQRPAANDSFQFDGDTDKWYTVNTATALVAGESTVTFSEQSGNAPSVGTTVRFYQPSFISASSQTFEYVGTGTNILTATPRLGGVPIQANEVTQLDGGVVNWTSTDQFGDFRIGGGLLINEAAGIITGSTFERSLFSILTPYILALEG